MSNIHEELEIGQHLDQATRETLIGVSQLIERLQRSAAERDRAAAQAIRDSMRLTGAQSDLERTSRARMRRYVEDVLGKDADDVLPATEAQEAYLRNVGLMLNDAELTINEASAILTAYEAHSLSRGDRDGAAQLLTSLRPEGAPAGGAEHQPDLTRPDGRDGDESLREELPIPAEAAALVLPAYRANPDRGVSPSKAATPEEALHRRQTWAMARSEWDAEHPELTSSDRTAAWDALPMQEKTDRYWTKYDTEEARTVLRGAGSEAGKIDRLRREVADMAANVPTDMSLSQSRYKGMMSRLEAKQRQLRELEEGAAASSSTSNGATQTEPAATQQPERGFSPGKASNAAEAAHRREAWRIAEGAFVAEQQRAGVTSSDARSAWRALDWPDRALRYWTAYDGTAAGSSTAATSEGTEQTQTPAAPDTVTRDRVIELNGQAAEFFSTQASPGSRGRDYFEDRLGSEAFTALTGGRSGASGTETPKWQLGYASGQWRGLTDHLRKKGATDEELVAAGLARISSRGGLIDAFRDRAMVGIRDADGAIVGFVGRDLSGHPHAPKYVNTGTTPAFVKGDHVIGLAEAPAGTRVVRVEGPFDALAVSAAGSGQYAGVAPMGTALTGTQADKIAARAVNGRTWVALDGDKAGRRATEHDFWEMRRRDVDVRLLSVGEGEDPGSVWRDAPERLRAELARAELAPTAGLTALDNALALAKEAARAGEQSALEDLAWTREEIARGLPDEDVQELDRRAKEELERLENHPDTPAPAPSDHPADVQSAAAHNRSTEGDRRLTDREAVQSAEAYNRGAEADRLTDREAAVARQISGRGFARSTEEMLTQAQAKTTGRRARPQRNPQRGLGSGHHKSL